MLHRISLFSGLFGLALLAGSAHAAPAGYNGTWGIQLVTEQGSCGGSYAYAVQVRDGAAHLTGPEASSASVSGGVASNGEVALTLTRSLASATASGRLNGNRGAGTWHVDMLGCSGHWTAARRA
jgi:hypothetical protein